MELLLEQVNHGMILSLLLSLPVVLTAALIGLVVGVIQAVTQIQEQTISSAIKIVGVFLVIIIGGRFMMDALSDYIRDSFQVAFNDMPQDGLFILPTETRRRPGEMRARRFFALEAKEGTNSAKFKDFASHWEMPDNHDGNATILPRMKVIRPPLGKGDALEPSEKLILNRSKQ